MYLVNLEFICFLFMGEEIIVGGVMMDDNCVYLTQSSLIRGLSKKEYNVLVDVSLKINDLRNCAVDKSYLVKSSDGKHYEKINYQSVIKEVKNEFREKYSLIQAHLANGAIKQHVESFNSFVVLKNKVIDKEYDRKVSEPKKHDDNHLQNIIIPKESITSSKKKLEAGYIELPLSREYKKMVGDYRPRIKIPENIKG